MKSLVQLGSVLAALGAAHAAVNARLLRRPVPTDAPLPRISALVPARDEARTIGDCVRALLAQEVAEILVLDDESSDGTADAAQAAAGGDPRVRVLRGTAPPSGWLGKPHACAQLVAAADPASSVLVFVDADVLLAPQAIRSAVETMLAAGLDVVSPYPRQRAESMPERIVQPLLQWSWLTFLPLRLAERSRRPSLAAANGQFLVLRRDALAGAGGYAAVRDSVLDDIALLRAITASGGHGGVVDGTRIASCRMYAGWRDLQDGYGKSLWAAFGSTRGAAAVLLLLTLTYVVPPLAAVRGSRAGALGYAAGVAGRLVTARATGARAWPDAFAHPVSVGVFGYLTARSVVLRRRGSLRWKGRPV